MSDLNLTENLIPLFCYGSNNDEQVRRRVGNPNIKSYKAILKNYRRFFCGYSGLWDGGIASVMYTDDPVFFCRGSCIFVSLEELQEIDKYEGTKSSDPYNENPSTNFYRRQIITITLINKNENENENENENGEEDEDEEEAEKEEEIDVTGIVYIKNIDNWEDHPSNSYLSACYKTIQPHWSDLDGNDKINIYDNNGNLKEEIGTNSFIS